MTSIWTRFDLDLTLTMWPWPWIHSFTPEINSAPQETYKWIKRSSKLTYWLLRNANFSFWQKRMAAILKFAKKNLHLNLMLSSRMVTGGPLDAKNAKTSIPYFLKEWISSWLYWCSRCSPACTNGGPSSI